MNRKRTVAAAVLAAAVITGGLTGCSGNSNNGSSGGVTTINWWTRLGDGQKELAKEFNSTHKNIQVKVTQISDDQYVNKVGTGVKSSNGPDVLDFDVANAPLFAATGVLSDISDKVNKLSYKDDLNAGMAKLAQYDNKWYSLPFNGGPSFILYNKTLFQKAGLDPNTAPTTWADIEKDAKAVRALGGDTYGWDIPGACGGGLSFTVNPFIWASGGDTLTKAGSNQKTTYASEPAVADTFNFYKKLWDDGVVAPRAQTTDCATWGQEWQAGKVGMIVSGAWMISPVEKLGDQVGYTAIPGENGGTSTFAGGNNDGIVSTSKKQDADWTFLSWLMEKDAQVMMAKSNGQAPVRSDIKVDTPLTTFQQTIGKSSNAPDSIASNALQLSASSPWLSAFQQIVFQGKDPKTVLKKADSDSAELLKQAYQQVGN
jgi:multiple sugar transport system substrate-binding protein